MESICEGEVKLRMQVDTPSENPIWSDLLLLA